jgi:hypothetical protein
MSPAFKLAGLHECQANSAYCARIAIGKSNLAVERVISVSNLAMGGRDGLAASGEINQAVVAKKIGGFGL